MGNTSSHTASFLGGTGLAAAILGILTQQFHIDGGLAGNWLIVVSAFVGAPLLAYLSIKAKNDPALAAALAAMNSMAAANGHGTTVEATPTTTTVTNPVPATTGATGATG